MLIEVKDNLSNAKDWLDAAIEAIDGNDLSQHDFDRYLESQPELKVLYEKIQVVRKGVVELSNFTPELDKQLADEEEHLSEMEDRADAMNY